MMCPKCSYISYDMPERCRNCGYDFPLASEAAPVDLDLRSDRCGPRPDFALSPERELPLLARRPTPGDAVGTPRSPLAVRRSPTDPSRQRPVPKRVAAPARPARRPPVIVTPAPPRADTTPLLCHRRNDRRPARRRSRSPTSVVLPDAGR
jgi:hypothetical protein